MLGEDFNKARSAWLYPQAPLQQTWRAIAFFVLLFLIFAFLQGVFALIVFAQGLGGDLKVFAAAAQGLQLGGAGSAVTDQQMTLLLKAMLIGMFPAGLVTSVIALYFAQFGLPKRMGHLPMEWPKFGLLGWVALIVGFLVFMAIVFNLLFVALGIDPSSYATSTQGLADDKSNAGIVEKTLADLARDPRMFFLAVPGAVLGAPLAEELIFRGALFAGLVQSRLGRPGAVIITAGLWSLGHAGAAPWMFVGVIFLMGLILGVLLLRFGSIWVTIACHTAWNAVTTLAMFTTGGHS